MKPVSLRPVTPFLTVLIAASLAGCGSSSASSKDQSTDAASAPTLSTIKAPSTTEHYLDSAYGIEFDYPKDWTVQKDNVSGIIYVFIDPESGTDGFRRNINILQQKSTSFTNLSDYTTLSNKQVQALNQYKQFSSKSTNVGVYPATELEYEAVFTGATSATHVLSVWAVPQSGVADVVTYTSSPGNYTDAMDQVNALIQSVTIKAATN